MVYQEINFMLDVPTVGINVQYAMLDTIVLGVQLIP